MSHPFLNKEISSLNFNTKRVDEYRLEDDDIIKQATVHESGENPDGSKWEYGSVSTRYNDYAYYSVDGVIEIFDAPPGDYFGHTLFGDTLILVGHDGAKYYNVKTFEFGGIY